jgi:hypothetical protein
MQEFGQGVLLVVPELKNQTCLEAPERPVLLAGLVEDVGSALDLLFGLDVEHLPMDVVGLLVELVEDGLGKDRPLFHPEQVRVAPVCVAVQDELRDAFGQEPLFSSRTSTRGLPLSTGRT